MHLEHMGRDLLTIAVYIVMPGLAGIMFISLAKFVKHIAPLRALVASPETYRAAFWGFLVFGLYFGLRIVQVFAGPHPWPLVISTLREFLLMAGFAPACFIGMMTLCLGPERIGKGWVFALFGASFAIAVLYCGLNAKAIGGSEEIVRLGRMTAYDGLWSKSGREGVEGLMRTLAILRLINPAFLLIAGATAVILHARNYPAAKRRIYDNMPRKLILLGTAVYAYAFSIVVGSVVYGIRSVPDQWWLYHLASLGAGLLETISLAMPVRSDVEVSEHEET